MDASLKAVSVLIITVEGKTVVVAEQNRLLLPYFPVTTEGALPRIFMMMEFEKMCRISISKLSGRVKTGVIHQNAGLYYHAFSIEMTREEIQVMVDKEVPLSLIRIPETVDPEIIDPMSLRIFREWEVESTNA